MAASPQVITNNPLYLNGRTLVYTAQELRKIWGDVVGQGCLDYDSFRIRQRAAGASMSVDVQTASVANRAFLRGSVVNDQGIYRVDFNSASVTNLDIAASDPTNPRIDSIYLCVEDLQHTGGNDRATARVVTGTATGGATVLNRTGAGSAPAGMSSMLLADILVAAGVGTIVDAAIQDRRVFPHQGRVPPLLTSVDSVAMLPGAQATVVGLCQGTTAINLQQGAAQMFLPQKMTGVTKIRWAYVQGATATTTQYVLGIYDASGRLVASTAATAYTGSANQAQYVSVPLLATTGFEPGNYYVVLGNATGTASGTVTTYGVATGNQIGSIGPCAPNMCMFTTGGGTTLPNNLELFTDSQVSGAGVQRIVVPIVALSVA